MGIRALLIGSLLLVAARPAASVPVPGTCQFTALANHVLAPVDLNFPIGVAGTSAAVTIDGDAGSFVLDGASITVAPYSMPFSEANDVIDFADASFTGTIDSSGAIALPGVSFTICTMGQPAGTDCVPKNLCSNDTSRICIRGVGGGTGCTAGGVCQGVCRDDRSRTCADDTGCAPGDVCGTGTLVPFTLDLTTGPTSFGDITLVGSPVQFGTGSLTLVGLDNTPPESPIIGDSGITSLVLSCTLAPVPAAATLPAPPAWTVKRGQAKLGKTADSLKLAGTFSPLAGMADFAANDLVVTLGTSAATVLSLRIPAGALEPNANGKVLKLVDTSGRVALTPTPPVGTTAKHKIKLKRKGDGYQLTLKSTGLVLDGLAGDQVVTALQLGFQNASATRVARSKRRSITF
jgi:hypothetical protein